MGAGGTDYQAEAKALFLFADMVAVGVQDVPVTWDRSASLLAAMISTYTCRGLNESQPNLFRGTDSREDTAAVPRVAVEAINVYCMGP